MPQDFGWQLVLVGGTVIVIQAGLHFGLWIWMLKATGLLVRAKGPEPICDIVWRTSERMQVPYRAIWILRNPLGYAAAFPTTRDLIFSEGLLASHPEGEIAAICAHELAHLSEPRRLVFARVLGAMSLCPLIFIRPMAHAFDFTGIAILLVPMVLAAVFARRLGRKMEVRADAVANQNATEAGVYARALERLYRTNQMPAVMRGKRQIHPHLYDRLLAAGVTPDYPRPKPPATLYWTSGLMYAVVVILFFVAVAMDAPP
jgi:Zn-dependent protease with chaperone function